jgi:hypothetical protein
MLEYGCGGTHVLTHQEIKHTRDRQIIASERIFRFMDTFLPLVRSGMQRLRPVL